MDNNGKFPAALIQKHTLFARQAVMNMSWKLLQFMQAKSQMLQQLRLFPARVTKNINAKLSFSLTVMWNHRNK